MRWDYFKPKSRRVNNAILTAKTRGWQRLIVCNLQPMTHQTTSSIEQALLIYTMMSGGLLHLSRIMCGFMYHASEGPRDQRLPFPVLITRLATANGFAPSPEDEIGIAPLANRRARSASPARPRFNTHLHPRSRLHLSILTPLRLNHLHQLQTSPHLPPLSPLISSGRS
ncbi:hypothetical protein PIB30_040892 [Stylosanthes scabra]|uniref:Uncharacterized protein n=1 Tax=Stylosanthes scabra TaxID=79078 RepID=A0ABU6UDE3_9FABA|nr:hypothetical protein [Stylosanthes scabra]